MSRFEGDHFFPRPLEIVSEKLSDATFLAHGFKNIEKITSESHDSAEWKLRTALSFLNAVIDIQLKVTERSSEKSQYHVYSKGIGASSTIRATLTYHPAEGGTRVHYVAEITERTGLLKIVSPGLIQSTAKLLIEEAWKSLEEKLVTIT
jgi:carbon monoxide dehydrogenase subunit G